MHRVAEVGIAAHWRYKEGGSASDRDYDAKLAWLRQLMDWQREVSDATEFVEGLKLDVFQDQVFVFTPKGDVKDLPAGATPLDFAYRIHTDVGHRMHRRQGQQPPRAARLPAQERRHRRDRHHQGGPRPVARLAERSSARSHAREKIRQWFKRQERDENIVHGREALDRELRRLARTSLETARLGQGRRDGRAPTSTARSTTSTPPSATARWAPSRWCMRLGVVDDANQTVLPQVAPPAPSRAGGVRVKGVGDLLVRFAKCCHPIPGDPIAGFITRGKGITVHLRTCPTVLNERDVEPAHRGRVGGPAPADLPDRHPHRGLRPDRPAVRHLERRRREQGEHRRRQRDHEPRPHGDRAWPRSRWRRWRSWPACSPASSGLKDVYTVQRDFA